MPGIKDFLFGSGPLKQAAGTPTPAPTQSGSAGLDMAKLAQDSADRAQAAKSPQSPKSSGSPLSSTMTPVAPKKQSQ